MKILLYLSGAFFGVLCIFSIVTGIIYMSGKRELNPLELSDEFVARLDTAEKRNGFAKKMGLVTFIVGIVQGLTAYSLVGGRSPLNYFFALGFDIFSIVSVLFKLRGKINAFPLLKLIAYVFILIVILQRSIRGLYF